LPVWADGELDTSFGTNGIVKIGFPNSSLGYLHDVALVSGAIEAAGFERETTIFGKHAPVLSQSLRPAVHRLEARPMVVTGASSSCAAMLYDARIRSVFLRGRRMRQGKVP